MKNRIRLLNTNIDNYSMKETLNYIEEVISSNKHIQHVVVNAGKIVAMQQDEQLMRSVNEADLINVDGQAVVWASLLLSKPLKERVTGIDLMENLVEVASKNNYKIFFFGAKEEVVARVVKIYSERYSPNIIGGYRNGYFKKEDEPGIAQHIADSGSQILFVAISSPAKENFLFDNKEVLKKINFTMGVGGSFDVVAGKVKRAPKWIHKLGLEWFYRLIQEPKRLWKRYLIGNLKFIFLVFREKFFSSKSKKTV